MRNILLFDFGSSGVNYAQDIINRGYNPVALVEPLDKNDMREDLYLYKKQLYSQYENKVQFISLPKEYDEVLDLVKKLDPLLIFGCSDASSVIVTKLCNDLNMPSNSFEYVDNYIDKAKMHEQLKKHGVRYIRGKVVYSKQEALDYFREENFRQCIIKPSKSASSVGFHVCENIEDLEKYFDKEHNQNNFFGGTNEGLLLQEKISGDEWIVNTVSYNKVHRLLSIWKYDVVHGANNSRLFNYIESMNGFELGSNDVYQYILRVYDALHVDYGPIHAEVMVDEKGPVLIEVNPRVMGGSVTAKFQDKLFGHHDTDVVLDTFLHPNIHYSKNNDAYNPMMKGIIKFVNSSQKINVENVYYLDIFKHMKSWISGEYILNENGNVDITDNVMNACGIVHLACKNETQLWRDYRFVKNMQDNYLEVLFDNTNYYNGEEPQNLLKIDDIVNKYYDGGSIIIYSNKDVNIEGCIIADSSFKFENLDREFDTAIINLKANDSQTKKDLIDAFYNIVDNVKVGGKIIVPESSYWYLPLKHIFIECLFASVGIEIQGNNYQENAVVVGVKRR